MSKKYKGFKGSGMNYANNRIHKARRDRLMVIILPIISAIAGAVLGAWIAFRVLPYILG